MSPELVKIQSRELKFIFKLKKESSCSVELVNNSDQYVAFKVKTTSPKKYCVRPNIGIIKPNSTYDFTVIMQAQRSAPPDMECKDKFLIQSTIVPFGTTPGDITPDMFSKDKGNYIEETKLRVVLVSPPNSPIMRPINGKLKQQPLSEDPMLKDQEMAGVENFPAPHMVAMDVEGTEVAEDKELRPKRSDDVELVNDVEELKLSKNIEELKSAWDIKELKLSNDVDRLKSKVNELEKKLLEDEGTIMKLTEERCTNIQESERLQKELVTLRRTDGARRVQVGFPPLFVLMVALISLTLGYLSRC